LFLQPPFERNETREEKGRRELISSKIQAKTRNEREQTKKERRREKLREFERIFLSELFEVRNHHFIVKSKAEIAPPIIHPRAGKST
jgi:hypothetical protein